MIAGIDPSYIYFTGNKGWRQIPLSSLGIDGEMVSFTVDPFSPAYTNQGDDTVNGMMATTQGTYRITDLFGSINATLVEDVQS